MGLIPEQEHLTVTDPAFEAQRMKTWPGMAHFAGTGPALKTCRECVFWDGCGSDPGHYSKNGPHGGAIKPRACRRYMELMSGTQGPAIPHNAAACKHFKRSPEAPAILQKW